MGEFVKGDVVVAPFPYSDLSGAKKRPALVVAALTGDDIVVCQITSQSVSDNYAVSLSDADFASGKLKQASHIRPNRLFTADSKVVLYRAGTIQGKKMMEVTSKIVQIFTACLLLATSLSHAATTIDANAKYAYSENGGWINFASTDAGATVTRTALSGFAWCETAGWIKLGSDAGGPYANTSASNWGVNVAYSANVPGGGGACSGYSWSENSGWINFAPKDGGVSIGADGTFDGYAWSETLGFIHFDKTSTVSVKALLTPLFISGPNIDAVAMLSGLVGTYSAMTDIPGAVVTWNFGDGSSPVTGNSVTHIYVTPGTYNVTVTTTANGLSTTTTLSVTVSDSNSVPGTTGIRVTTGQIKLGGATDLITFRAFIHLDARSDITKIPLTLGIGGVTQTFNFSKNGTAANSPNAKATLHFKGSGTSTPGQEAHLNVSISGTGFKNLISQGVAVDAQGLPAKVLVTFGFNGQPLTYVNSIAFKKNGSKTVGTFGFK